VPSIGDARPPSAAGPEPPLRPAANGQPDPAARAESAGQSHPAARADRAAQPAAGGWPPVILVVGPTGVGKSQLALDLAERLDGEIVSADSRQVYRGLEIGTAQPESDELARVPHHLVGLLSPDQPFSAADFVDLAERALGAIAARGRVGLVVGGTYHYVQALLDGLELPRVAPRPALRRALEAEAQRAGPDALHRRLAELDPAAAAEIPAANVRRLVRALEVIETSGQRFSELGRRRGPARPALRLAVSLPRPELYRRVDRRVDQMLARGWLEEVRRLLRAGYPPSLPALTSTGYRELLRHLRGELTLDEATRLVKYSTHAYIRRQYAWLRRDPRLIWLEQGPDVVPRALALARAYLAEPRVREETP
jgi:tRNA dimethylallyltransferase